MVLFAPYYFNAYMSFQMTGVTNILVGPGSPDTLHPDAGKKLHDLVAFYVVFKAIYEKCLDFQIGWKRYYLKLNQFQSL